MSSALVNGIQVHYQRKGEGPDVILIHGVTSSLALWYGGVFTELAQTFSVTAYDLRGHGRTDITPSGYTTLDLAGDLVGLMDHLGIVSARFVGHSYGGCVAMHMALLYPERVDGVVLLDSGLACLRHLRTIDQWSGWTSMRSALRKYGFSRKRFMQIDSQDDVSEIFRRSLRVPVQFGFRKGLGRATPRLEKLINETSVGRDFRAIAGMTVDRLPEIGAPVLALYGETSPYLKIATHLTEALPRCVTQTLPETGHFYLLREPKSAVERMTAFLIDPAGYVRAAPPPGALNATAEMTLTFNEE